MDAQTVGGEGMGTEKSPWDRFTEWWAGHAFWEALKTLIGAAIVSIGGTRLAHATFETGLNVFILIVGILGIGWGIRLLPVRKSEKPSPFSEALVQKCDDVTLAWKVFAEDYGRHPNTEAGQTATVPNPMDVAWSSYGFKEWHYRVGFLQGKTYALLGDLTRVGIQVEQFDCTQLTMAELLHALGKYQLAASRVVVGA
jgi:hypothetical protein